MSTSQPIDVRDMAIVHRTFNRVYGEAIELVGASTAPSSDRVNFLADHIDFGVMMLHHHHEGEDESLYPLLIERAPEQASVTEDVEHEHQLVKTSLDQVSTACSTWRRDPAQRNRDALVGALQQLQTVLETHVRDEEEKVVPLAAVTLTQDEWDGIGKRAVAAMPGKWRPIAFGLLLEPLDDADRTYMKSNLPAPIRLLFPLLIERPWRRYSAKLRGGG